MHLQHPEEYNTKMPLMKEKLAAGQDLLQEVAEQNRLTEDEVTFITGLLQEQAAIIDILKEENFEMKEKLPHLQPLHEEVLKYKKDASDTILSLTVKLNELQLKILDLEKKLTQFGVDVVFIESSKTKEIDVLNQQWQEKLKNTDNQSKKIIEEIVKKHCETKKGYETIIHGLKEQVAHKEAEVGNLDRVAWCQLMMRERDSSIDKQLGNLKKELEVTTLKNQELLQQRLVEVERRANKMTRKCLKLQNNYEHKISVLKKEKELQVQVLHNHVQLKAERDTNVKENKIVDAVKALELRYRKIIINLHTAAQEQRLNYMQRIATLENAITTGIMPTKEKT